LEQQKPDLSFSLEEELESLPAHESGKSASNSELSVEDELALLSKQSSVEKNKQGLHLKSLYTLHLPKNFYLRLVKFQMLPIFNVLTSIVVCTNTPFLHTELHIHERE